MYYLYLIGRTLCSILSRKTAYFLAWGLASIQYRLAKKDAKAVRNNLAAVISDPVELEKACKNVFLNFSYYLVDFLRYSRMNKRYIEKHVRLVGWKRFNDLISLKKPVIFLTAHIGNYELAGAAVALMGYKLSVVALPHKDKKVNSFFDGQRKRVGMEVISTGVAVKRCYKTLKSGGMCAFLGDRDFSNTGLKVSLCGRIAEIPRGPAYFAAKTNAFIVPVFLVRRDKYYYDFIMDKPITFGQDGINSEDDMVKAYAQVIGEYIKKYPDQWYMFQKYWAD